MWMIKGLKIKLPKIGMRSIKTVLATFLAIVISNLIGFQSPFFITLTAFLCIQGSIIETSEMAVKRSVGTFIGGIFSLFYLVFIPDNIYLIPLGLLIIIYLFNLFDKSNLITITCVVFLVITFRVNTSQQFETIVYVSNRLWQTFIGVLIAMLVNYYIKPPKPFEKLKELNYKMIDFINQNIKGENSFNRVNNIEEYRLEINDYDSLIQSYYKESNKGKVGLDIDYYSNNLALFKNAYSHFLILNSLKEGIDMDIQNYHIRKLLEIKETLGVPINNKE